MKLLPNDLAVNLPSLYSTEDENDPTAYVKFFTPDSNWSWYLIEYDSLERLCFGYVIGFEKELGYFSLGELENIRGRLGLPVERDLYFTPTPLSVLRQL